MCDYSVIGHPIPFHRLYLLGIIVKLSCLESHRALPEADTHYIHWRASTFLWQGDPRFSVGQYQTMKTLNDVGTTGGSGSTVPRTSTETSVVAAHAYYSLTRSWSRLVTTPYSKKKKYRNVKSYQARDRECTYRTNDTRPTRIVVQLRKQKRDMCEHACTLRSAICYESISNTTEKCDTLELKRISRVEGNLNNQNCYT